MRCSKINYGRTVALAKYESFRLDMEVELQPGEDTNDALQKLTASVDAKCAEIKAKFTHQKPA